MLISMIRSIILYLLLILAVRLMGKRQIGQLEPSEFVIALLIADLASVPMQDLGIPLLAGVVPILTVLSVEILLSALSYHVIWIRKLLCGTSIILMENGEILHRNMKRNRITTDELIEQLREKGFLDLAKIKYAILETNGQISVFSQECFEPVTKADLQIETQNSSMPLTLISDGTLLYDNLQRSCYSEQTLLAELKKQGLAISQIFLLTANASGTLYIARKQDSE